MSVRTKSDYDKALIRIADKFGSYPLEVIDDPKIRVRFLEWRDDMAKASPRQADAVIAVLRVLLEWVRDRGLVTHNHITWPKKVYQADRAVAPPEIRLAFELALATGQRKSFLLALTWDDYDGERIRRRQTKSKRQIDMPITRALKAILDAQPGEARTILTRNGKPWGSVNFDYRWRETVVAAGRGGLHDASAGGRDTQRDRRHARLDRLDGRQDARRLSGDDRRAE